MNPPAYLITRESITVIWQGKPHVVQKGSPQFNNLRAAIIEERWEDVPRHLTVRKSLQTWAKGEFTIDESGETVFYRGESLPRDINARICEMASAGEDPTPLLNFWERLQRNPSFRSVEQLFPFLNHKGIPITPDGCFLAYKGVNNNYTDCHTGEVDNRPGTKHEMPRNKISDDPEHACHYGYHVGAERYAKGFGSRMVICKIDPEHVVCVPYDSSKEKMRVCKYEVIGNYGDTLPSTTYNDKEDPATSSPHRAHDCVSDDSGKCEVCGEELETDIEEDEGNLVDDADLPPEETESSEEDEEEKRKAKKGFSKFDKMGFEDLAKQSIEALRKYAGKGLQIVGASKIPGGKPALIATILKVRA